MYFVLRSILVLSLTASLAASELPATTRASPEPPRPQRGSSIAAEGGTVIAAEGSTALMLADKGGHAAHVDAAPARPARSRGGTRANRAAQRALLPAPAPPPVLLDVMVVAVAPGTVAELSATGRELAPLATHPAEGTDFLDGPGPGIKLLAFDRVEPRLNEHLPWGEVGAHRNGYFEIRRRVSVLVPPGGRAQVPLEAARVLEEPTHREAIVKQALVVHPEALPDGRVRLRLGLRKGVAFPDDIDPSMFTGGRLGCTTEIAPGQEIVVTGLSAPVPAVVVHDDPVDPFERFRRPRLRDRERARRWAPAPCPGQLVVRLLVRPAATSVSP